MSERTKNIIWLIGTLVAVGLFSILAYFALTATSGRDLVEEQINEVRSASSRRVDQLLVYMEGQSQEIKQLVAENASLRAQIVNAGLTPYEIETRPTIQFLPEEKK